MSTTHSNSENNENVNDIELNTVKSNTVNTVNSKKTVKENSPKEGDYDYNIMSSYISGFIVGSISNEFIGLPGSIILSAGATVVLENKEYVLDKAVEYYSKLELEYENMYNNNEYIKKIHNYFYKEQKEPILKITNETVITDKLKDVCYTYKENQYNVVLNKNENSSKFINELLEKGKRAPYLVTKATICSDTDSQDVMDIVKRYSGPKKDFYSKSSVQVKGKDILECILEKEELNDHYLYLEISYRGQYYVFRFNPEDTIDINFESSSVKDTNSDGFVNLDSNTLNTE